jgi:hypothetical protein
MTMEEGIHGPVFSMAEIGGSRDRDCHALISVQNTKNRQGRLREGPVAGGR